MFEKYAFSLYYICIYDRIPTFYDRIKFCTSFKKRSIKLCVVNFVRRIHRGQPYTVRRVGREKTHTRRFSRALSRPHFYANLLFLQKRWLQYIHSYAVYITVLKWAYWLHRTAAPLHLALATSRRAL